MNFMNKSKLMDQEKFLSSIMNVSGNIRYVIIYDLKGNVIFKRKIDRAVDFIT